jgi:hypothetical protein
MAYPIEGMLGRLLGKLRAIDNNFDNLPEKELRSRWNTAQSLLQQIWAKIKREKIDPREFEEELSSAHSMVEVAGDDGRTGLRPPSRTASTSLTMTDLAIRTSSSSSRNLGE